MIYYYSLTGNVRRFVQKMSLPCREITNPYEIVDHPYVLITPTTGFGQVPSMVDDFVQYNVVELRGVVVSGNANWGRNYGAAGYKIADEYGVPLLLRFELSGTDEDIAKFKAEVERISQTTSN